MDIFQIVALGIVTSILTILLKEQKTSLAFFLILITSIVILIVVLQQISEVLRLVGYIGQKANIESMYIETILKIIGIAYITEFGAHMTRDAGLSSVAAKIELAGKIFILVLAVPILTAVIEAILNFIQL